MVDFSIITPNRVYNKSEMSPEEWAKYYPAEDITIHDTVYHLFSMDVLDILIHATKDGIRLVRPELGENFRLFCHHNGIATLDSNEYTGTTFGVIYSKLRFMYTITIGADGSISSNTEET